MSISYCDVPGSGKMAANLLIHIPHASLHLPPDFWSDVTVDGFVMLRDYLIDA